MMNAGLNLGKKSSMRGGKMVEAILEEESAYDSSHSDARAMNENNK